MKNRWLFFCSSSIWKICLKPQAFTKLSAASFFSLVWTVIKLSHFILPVYKCYRPQTLHLSLWVDRLSDTSGVSHLTHPGWFSKPFNPPPSVVKELVFIFYFTFFPCEDLQPVTTPASRISQIKQAHLKAHVFCEILVRMCSAIYILKV